MQATFNSRTALFLSFLTLLAGAASATAPASAPLLGAEVAHAGGDDDDLDDLEIQR